MMKRMIVTAALATAMLFGAMSAPASAKDGPNLHVVGDSITAWYNDAKGHPMRGWWSMLAERKGMAATTSAIGGTGFLRPCNGAGQRRTNFRERLGAVRRANADVLIVEGGRNDWRACNGKRYSDKQIRQGVNRYFKSLRTVVRQERISKVYVTTVWGSRDHRNRDRIAPVVKRYAERYGFKFKQINLTRSQTLDGTHPNERGNRKIAKIMRKIVKRS